MYNPDETAPDVNKYARMVIDSVGHAGILVGSVENIKSNDMRRFIIDDVAMNDLIRPTLYGAYHHILAVKETKQTAVADLVGPICESGDYMCKNVTHQ